MADRGAVVWAVGATGPMVEVMVAAERAAAARATAEVERAAAAELLALV